MKNPPTILNYDDSFDYASRCVMAMLQSARENDTQLNGDAVLSVLFTTAWGMALGAGIGPEAMITKFMMAKGVIDDENKRHSRDDDSTGGSGGLPSTGTEEGFDDEYGGSGGDC